MKASISTAAFVMLFALTACGGDMSKGAFEKLINASLEDRGPFCWALEDMPKDLPVRVNIPFGGKSEVEDSPIISGLVEGGYLEVETEYKNFGIRSMPRADVFTLTDKGRAAGVWDQQSGFCLGRRVVHEILHWTEPVNGMTEVTYTWVLGKRPRWASEELFGEVEGISEPVKATKYFRKTSDGWKDSL